MASRRTSRRPWLFVDWGDDANFSQGTGVWSSLLRSLWCGLLCRFPPQISSVSFFCSGPHPF